MLDDKTRIARPRRHQFSRRSVRDRQSLSPRTLLTLNGRLLPAQKTDVLADGDTIQIGPFAIEVAIDKANAMRLSIQRFGVAAMPSGESQRPQTPASTQAARRAARLLGKALA